MVVADLPDRLFVAGTDTEVGKTVVSAILVAGTKAVYWKPVQSGTLDSTDTAWVRQKTRLPKGHFLPETYRLSQPLSPHAAAAIDGIHIDLEKVTLPDPSTCPRLIVEGAGGLMVPLNRNAFMLDLILHLKLPVLLVARSTLGTINHTLLSLMALRQRAIPVAGVVMNGARNRINRDAVETYGRVPVVAVLDRLASVDRDGLQKAYHQFFGKFAAF